MIKQYSLAALLVASLTACSNSVSNIQDTSKKQVENNIAQSEPIVVRTWATTEEEFPKVGVVTYRDKRSYQKLRKDGSVYERGWGDSFLTVNFKTKIVKGKFTGKGINVQLPTVKIKGTSFSLDKKNFNIRGYFYGHNAEQLGGVYEIIHADGGKTIIRFGGFSSSK